MKRHRFDALSFIFGAAFISLTALLAAGEVQMGLVRLQWFGAAFLLAVGVLLLATSRKQPRNGDDS